MDTQSMVNQLMRAESMRMERLTRRRQVLQWRQESIRNSMTQMNDFRREHTDATLGSRSINNPATWNTIRASVTGVGGGAAPAGVSVTTTNGAKTGSFDVEVLQTAQGDMVRGTRTGPGNHGGKFDLTNNELGSTTIGSLFGFSGSEYVNINGVNIRANSSDTVSQFMSRVNGSDANVTMRYNSVRGNFEIENRETGANATVRTGGGAVLTGMGLANIRFANPGNPVLSNETFLNTSITAATGLAPGSSITISNATQTFTIDVASTATTFQQFMNAVNEEINDHGMYLEFSHGSFVLRGDPGVSFTTGDEDLWKFMDLANRNPVDAAITFGSVVAPLDLTADTTVFNAFFGENTNDHPNGDIVFNVGGQDITINALTEWGDFLTQMDDAGLEVDINIFTGSITISNKNGGFLPGITADPDDENSTKFLTMVGVTPDAINAANTVTYSGNGNVSLNARISAFSGDGIPAGGGTVQIGRDSDGNPAEINIYANDTFQSFMGRVNAADTNVTMTFNSGGRFAFIPKGTAIVLTGDEPFLKFLGLDNIGSATDSTEDTRLINTARNAIIIYDNDPTMRIEQASNTFEFHGHNITLSTNMRNADGESIREGVDGVKFTVNAERDVSIAIDAIRHFVEAYNDLLRQINSLHTTARPRAGNRVNGAFYEPLTDEQKQAMSDREVERWEEQARTGLLHRDRDIRSLHDQMRRAMFERVNLGDGRSIAIHEIGITTVGRDGAPGDQLIGVLQIDEDVLRKALEERSEDVQALFSRSGIDAGDEFRNSSTIQQRNARAPHVGLGFRLDDLLRTFAQDRDGPLQQRAGYHSGLMVSENTMSRQIRDYNERISRMEVWLQRRENHYFSMFAKMEAAMQESHSQMDALFAFATQ